MCLCPPGGALPGRLGSDTPFLTTGGTELQRLELQGMHYRAQELFNLEVDTGPGQSRQVLPPGGQNNPRGSGSVSRDHCAEAIPGQCAWSRAPQMGSSRGASPSAQGWGSVLPSGTKQRKTSQTAYSFRCTCSTPNFRGCTQADMQAILDARRP